MHTDEIVSRLNGVKDSRDGWMAKCPAHDDSTQSLHVSVGSDGKTLFKCFAGCSTPQIVNAMGLKMSDMFERNKEASVVIPSKIVAKYDYFDEQGVCLFQVVRKDPKGFFQRHSNGNGNWVNTMDGVRRVLYRLPQIVSADKSTPILFVEGEKDVEAAYKLGFTATTSPMGVGKWLDSYAESLRERNVILIPDNDEAGRKHMQQVSKALDGMAASVKWLELPNLPKKGDLSDWIVAGGTREKLQELVFNVSKPPDPREDEGDENTPTQGELRDRWIDKHPNTAYGMSEWKRYANGLWHSIPKEVVNQEITDVIEDAQSEGVRVTNNLSKSVMELARTKVFVPDDKWNSRFDVLVLTNGTLHIPTRTLKPHSPSDYETIGVSYPYDSTITSPVWEYFLQSTMQESASFFQEYAGYALTPETKYEISVWFVGKKGSGKSTGIAGLCAMLGDKVGFFGVSEVENSRFALGSLPGKTLVVATEQPEGFMRATHIFNNLVSGEVVKIEKKFEDSYSFKPHVKVVWAMNNPPRIPDPEDGLFRRVKIIQFPELPPEKRDPEIKEQIEKSGAAILNWALDGLERLLGRGRFDIPEEVVVNTVKFQETNDIPKHFVGEYCKTGIDCKVQSSVLYSAYKFWCVENSHKPQSSTSMASEWERLGFEKYMSNGKAFYKGVCLVVQIP